MISWYDISTYVNDFCPMTLRQHYAVDPCIRSLSCTDFGKGPMAAAGYRAAYPAGYPAPYSAGYSAGYRAGYGETLLSTRHCGSVGLIASS